uniref:DUF4371 domain-containing protein n=1 Tax=Sphaeramia orbicularis TaxID=375764 RepID=A0A673BZ39_9TELE
GLGTVHHEATLDSVIHLFQPDIHFEGLQMTNEVAIPALVELRSDRSDSFLSSMKVEKYAFVAVNANPVCLICNKCLAMSKEYNLIRHFNTTHANFNATFPLGSEAWRQKISGLTFYYEQRRRILVWACTDQERATAVVPDEKTRKSIIDSIKQIPISDTSNMRRVESLASDVFEMLLDKLRKADVIDVAQLCLYVRFFNGECFRKDLLGLIPLEGHTTGEILFNKIVSFFEEYNLDLACVSMLVMDGAPSMMGRDQGLAARMAAAAPQMRSLHCLIHQSLLCAKLSGELKETMNSVMAVINFIGCTSSLQHRRFRKLLTDMSAEYKDLLIHNDIRWLSKGNILKRFCELREEILVFLRSSKLKKGAKFLSLMENDEFNATDCFLSDVFHHLNQLNMELQVDLCPRKMLHFPTLRKYSLQITMVMSGFINSLKNNFATRFDDFSISSEMARFVKDPFCVNVESKKAGKELVLSLDEGFLQPELIDIQSSDDLRQSLQQAGFEKFWTHVVNREKFPHSRGLALFLLTIICNTACTLP